MMTKRCETSLARLLIIVVILTAILFFLTSVLPAWATAGVPENGSLPSNFYGWFRHRANWEGNRGHDANGAIVANAGTDGSTKNAIGSPYVVMPIAGDKNLSFWFMSESNNARVGLKAHSYTNGEVSGGTIVTATTAWTWYQATVDMSTASYETQLIIQPLDNWTHVDDMTTPDGWSNLPNKTHPYEINNHFVDDTRWVSFNADYDAVASECHWSDSEGYTNLGALGSIGSCGTVWHQSLPYVLNSDSNWSIWCKQASGAATPSGKVYWLDIDSTTEYFWTSDDLTCTSDYNWHEVNLTHMSGLTIGHRIVFRIKTVQMLVDDLCYLDCVGEATPTPVATNTPTPTQTPTNTPTRTPWYWQYGTSTPIPIYFETPVYPTQIPYPTFDWTNYPTPLYGLNTPFPVYWQTPMPVIVTNTVVVKVDDSTPIRVSFGDARYTPAAPGDIHGYGDPAVGDLVPGAGYDIDEDFDTTTFPTFGVGAPGFSMNKLINVAVKQTHGNFCPPSIGSLIGNTFCYDITVDYIDTAYVFGIDIGPWLLALGGALVFYTVIRQVQK